MGRCLPSPPCLHSVCAFSRRGEGGEGGGTLKRNVIEKKEHLLSCFVPYLLCILILRPHENFTVLHPSSSVSFSLPPPLPGLLEAVVLLNDIIIIILIFLTVFVHHACSLFLRRPHIEKNYIVHRSSRASCLSLSPHHHHVLIGLQVNVVVVDVPPPPCPPPSLA